MNESKIIPPNDRDTARPSLLGHGIKYLIVGSSSAVIELVVFQVLLSIAHFPIELSNIAAICCSTAFNFLMNRSFTFKSTSNPLRSLLLYIALFAFNTALTTTVLSFMVGVFGWNPTISKIITMACVVAWNFVLYRKVIFR